MHASTPVAMLAGLLLHALYTKALVVPTAFDLPQASPNGQAELAPHFRIPTVHESAVAARRILHLESIGTTSTIFPSTARPDVAGKPIGLMEYFADCEPETGNPTFLAITIATTFVNAAKGSNVTLSIQWQPPKPISMPPSGLPRVALMGHMEDIEDGVVKGADLEKCFLQKHSEAKAWTPGNDIHSSKWMRLVVDDLYFFGGYGDRAYIGWIPVDEWRGVTLDEVQKARLPGEQ